MSKVQTLLRRRLLSVAVISLLVTVLLGVQSFQFFARVDPASAAILPVTTTGPYTGTVGTPITMMASAPGATTPVFTWNFGDNTPVAVGATVTHAYASPFNFNVAVNMVDAAGGNTGVGMTTASITGGGTGVLLVSAGGPYSGNVSVPITFTATVASVANPQVTWTFGDGTTGTGLTTTHTYSTAGTFTVTVSATDPATGRTGTATTTAFVSVSGSTNCIPGLTGFNNGFCNFGGNCFPGFSGGFSNFCQGNLGCGFGGFCPSQSLYGPAQVGYQPTVIAGAVGCTSGVPPCAVGQTCTPVGLSQLSCTTAAPAATVSVTQPTISSASYVAPVQTTSAVPAGVAFSLSAGWNLVGGSPGETLPSVSAGPLTFSAASNSYQYVAPSQLQVGQGYWIQFDSAATGYLPAGAASAATVTLPVGQWAMIGNAGSTSATVSGADAVDVWDPVAGMYRQTTTLAPGQGAWAFSYSGATVTIR